MNLTKKKNMVPYLFILPAFIIHACIVTGPALSTLVMSLFDWNGMGGAKFIGLKNFQEIFTKDTIVKQAVIHNIQWLLVFITVPLLLGFIVAILVSQLRRTQMVFRRFTLFHMLYLQQLQEKYGLHI